MSIDQILGGGWEYHGEGEDEGDLVLKFDIEKEEYIKLGTMIYYRIFHAISLVQSNDYHSWCKI